jgi:hypothetical protein
MHDATQKARQVQCSRAENRNLTSASQLRTHQHRRFISCYLCPCPIGNASYRLCHGAVTRTHLGNRLRMPWIRTINCINSFRASNPSPPRSAIVARLLRAATFHFSCVASTCLHWPRKKLPHAISRRRRPSPAMAVVVASLRG